jgi:hypothetical protein
LDSLSAATALGANVKWTNDVVIARINVSWVRAAKALEVERQFRRAASINVPEQGRSWHTAFWAFAWRVFAALIHGDAFPVAALAPFGACVLVIARARALLLATARLICAHRAVAEHDLAVLERDERHAVAVAQVVMLYH